MLTPLVLIALQASLVAQTPGYAEAPYMGQTWHQIDVRAVGSPTGQADSLVDGVLYSIQPGAPASPSVETMLSLLYRGDSFANLDTRQRSSVKNHHTSVTIGQTASLVHMDFSSDGTFGRRGERLSFWIDVRPSAGAALRDVTDGKAHGQVVNAKDRDRPLSHLTGLGDDHWLSLVNDTDQSLTFLQGRVSVRILLYMPRNAGQSFLEAVALGTSYRILQHPDLSGMNAKRKVSINGQIVDATAVGDEAYAPAQSLARLGVSITRKGYDTLLGFGKHWVRITPFAWSAQTDAGFKNVPASFNGNDGLIIPLRGLSSALGLKAS